MVNKAIEIRKAVPYLSNVERHAPGKVFKCVTRRIETLSRSTRGSKLGFLRNRYV